jgi:HK97 family phage major capsid protein
MVGTIGARPIAQPIGAPAMKPNQLIQLSQELSAKTRRLSEIVDAAASARRDLTANERRQVERIRREAEALRARMPQPNPRLMQGTGVAFEEEDGRPRLLRSSDSYVDYLREREPHHFRSSLYDELLDPSRCSLGRFARGLVTGRWDGAEMEKRAMLEGGLTTGGALLPSPLSGHLIDLVRNKAQVLAAGATTVPMDTPTLFMGRLTAGPNPALAWKSEGAAIADSSLSVDRLTFTAQTLPCLVKVSFELFDDLQPQAADLIQQEIVKEMALALDLAALRGNGVAPTPLGLRFQSGVTLTSLGANGGSL